MFIHLGDIGLIETGCVGCVGSLGERRVEMVAAQNDLIIEKIVIFKQMY